VSSCVEPRAARVGLLGVSVSLGTHNIGYISLGSLFMHRCLGFQVDSSCRSGADWNNGHKWLIL